MSRSCLPLLASINSCTMWNDKHTRLLSRGINGDTFTAGWDHQFSDRIWNANAIVRIYVCQSFFFFSFSLHLSVWSIVVGDSRYHYDRYTSMDIEFIVDWSLSSTRWIFDHCTLRYRDFLLIFFFFFYVNVARSCLMNIYVIISMRDIHQDISIHRDVC